jgi:cysteine desulfurase
VTSPIYLDWNATTPPLPAAIEAMAEVARDAWGNPASVHRSGRKARDVVETAREALARLVGSSARDVIFTAGGTEANNLALHAAPGIVTSLLEHPSITRVAEALEAAGRPVRWVAPLASGELDPDAVGAALVDMPVGTIAAVAAANHETGVVQPMSAIAERVRAAQARLHVDAVQLFGKRSCDALALADTFSIAAHKLRGPKGIGALVHRPERSPKPLLLGGGQERGRRPGTVDPVAAEGFRVASLHAAEMLGERRRLALLRDRLESELIALGASVNGGGAERLEHVSNLSFEGGAGDELVAALDLLEVFVSSGSACSAGTTEPSKVITSMLGVQRARGAVRISLGETTTASEIDGALAAFVRVLRA